MGYDYLYHLAIQSVRMKDEGGRFVVVFFSPTKKEFTRLTGLSKPEAVLMVEMIQARRQR